MQPWPPRLQDPSSCGAGTLSGEPRLSPLCPSRPSPQPLSPTRPLRGLVPVEADNTRPVVPDLIHGAQCPRSSHAVHASGFPSFSGPETLRREEGARFAAHALAGGGRVAPRCHRCACVCACRCAGRWACRQVCGHAGMRACGRACGRPCVRGPEAARPSLRGCAPRRRPPAPAVVLRPGCGAAGLSSPRLHRFTLSFRRERGRRISSRPRFAFP